MSLIKFIGSVLFVAVMVFAAADSHGDQLNIYLKATPGFERLRPYADPATMALLITDAGGRPVTQGRVAIALDAPRPGHFFSTDFPWVEGTRLQELELNLRQGRANWKYLFPIRGEYRLVVEVATADGRKASKEFTFIVHESETKWAGLAGFSAALFCLGVMAGRIFTGVRTKAAMIATIALLFTLPDIAAGDASQKTDTATLEVEAATVGTPAVIRWHLESDIRDDLRTMLSLRITHIEKEKIAFEMERVFVAREFAMKFQFTDGAEYRVVAVAEPPGRPLIRSEKIASATALEPPTKAMIPAFTYFIGLIAVGLVVGRWSKRRVVIL